MMTEKELINSPLQGLSIDPGQSGAVWKIGRGAFVGKRDFKCLRDIANAIKELSIGVDFAVIEGVGAMPGQGVTSMFSFGRSTGVAFGALFATLPVVCPIYEVWPQRWQNYFRALLPEKTFDSRQVAAKIFPESAPQFLSRKLDHGTGDSILLCTYILQQPTEFLTQFLSLKTSAVKLGRAKSPKRTRAAAS